jgi:hypothetical protein
VLVGLVKLEVQEKVRMVATLFSMTRQLLGVVQEAVLSMF